MYTCYAQVDVPSTKRKCSRGADLLIMSEYSSTSTWLGSKHKQQATTGVMLDVFYPKHISSV